MNPLRADAPLDPSRIKRRRGDSAKAAPAPKVETPAASDTAEPPPGKRRRRDDAAAKPRRRRRGLGLFRLMFVLLIGGGLVAGVAGYGMYRQIAEDLPDYRWLADYDPPQMSRIYAADSRLSAELATERRVFVPIEAIPRRVQQAFVSAEDQRFWEHAGVDPLGIGRAVLTAIENYGSGRRMGGASTITQQVAKNMLVGADRTLMRKVREAILAVRIEQALSKERILELYLNEILPGPVGLWRGSGGAGVFQQGPR